MTNEEEKIPKPRRKDYTKRIDDKFVKCANCGGPHTASYTKCPARIEIMELRQAIHERKTKLQRKPVYNLYDTNEFQVLPQPGPPHGNNSWQNTPTSHQQCVF